MLFIGHLPGNSGSFPSILCLATITTFFLTQPVLATPISIPIGDYTVIPLPSKDEIKSWLKFTPEKDTCLFYTNELKDEVIAYAKANNKVTIWDIYPDKATDKTVSLYNRDKVKEYYQTAARVYAESCSGTTWIMIGQNNRKPCHDSILRTDELDVILHNSRFEPPTYLQLIENLDDSFFHYAVPPGDDGKLANDDHEGFPEYCASTDGANTARFTGTDPVNYWGL